MTVHLYDLVGRDKLRPFSPHCWKTAMSLAHKGLDFERVPTAFTAIPEIRDGASKTVPVITDGDRTVIDSFAIALYLDETYPDRPPLFGDAAGVALSRFVENWSTHTLHTFVGTAALVDIHDMLDPDDQAYFRTSREQRFGRALEEIVAGREGRVELFLKSLGPLRSTLAAQRYLGGDTPRFADFIVFGALQWLRVTCPMQVLPQDDPVREWFERCLDLYDGLGRGVPAAGA